MTNDFDPTSLSPRQEERLDRALDAWARSAALPAARVSQIHERVLSIATQPVQQPQQVRAIDQLPTLVFANFRALDARLAQFVPGWPAGLGPKLPALS